MLNKLTGAFYSARHDPEPDPVYAERQDPAPGTLKASNKKGCPFTFLMLYLSYVKGKV
jgi:hypothetical protein